MTGLLALLAVADCPGCAQPFVGQGLCLGCSDGLATQILGPRSRRFLVGLGSEDPPLKVRAWAAYAGDVPTLVQRFKFRDQRRLALPLAACMAQCVDEDLTDFDVLCPVPTHLSRYVQRGFNPGALLAGSLAPPGTVPIRRLLRRKPGRAPQSRLGLEERQEAPFGLFDANPIRRRELEGARVMLIDDVCTTGATLAASARALYVGGADWVEALVFARSLKQNASPHPIRDATLST